MSLERKNRYLQKKNKDLVDQVEDLKHQLYEREAELDADELRMEFISVIDQLEFTIEELDKIQNEYNEQVSGFRKLKNDFKKEIFREHPGFLFRRK